MNTRYAEVKNKSTPFPRQDCKIDKKIKRWWWPTTSGGGGVGGVSVKRWYCWQTRTGGPYFESALKVIYIPMWSLKEVFTIWAVFLCQYVLTHTGLGTSGERVEVQQDLLPGKARQVMADKAKSCPAMTGKARPGHAKSWQVKPGHARPIAVTAGITK